MKEKERKRKPATRKSGSKARATRSPAVPKVHLAIRSILVPIDFSAHSRAALRYAIPLAEQFGASLRLIYVVEPTIYPADLGFGQVVYPNIEEELEEKGAAELKSIIDKDIPEGVKASSQVRTGKPHQEILLEAEDQRSDLIVIATHGHTGVEHMLFGSTAERIVRNAKCPVMTIRPAVNA